MAQSSGECPGLSMTLRDGLEAEGARDEGAIAVFESIFVGGTRSIEAAEGGGRRALPFVGREGGAMELNVGGFSRGGSVGVIVGGCGGVIEGATGTPLCCGSFWTVEAI